MDSVRGFDDDGFDLSDSATADDSYGEVGEVKVEIGTDERRMHVRAYNHWVSLLSGRSCPSIEDLDPGNIADFGAHSVLLDFSRGIENPAIAYLGKALREECGLDSSITHIDQVPSRSLLSRLTDHYLQIIANRSPIGFEAEFVATRGYNTLYRGILMPFSSDADSIDFIYGVINWKELVDAATQAGIEAEVAAAVKAAPKTAPAASAWADGPRAGSDAVSGGIEDDALSAIVAGPSLVDQLMLAQQTAAAVRASDLRSRTTLYRALARAHDFAAAADADPVGYTSLLDTAGIAVQLRAPMTPVVKLVFGAEYDKTRLTEYAAVLGHARRIGLAAGALSGFLEGFEGGIKGVVKAERAARAPMPTAAADPAARFAARATLATVSLDARVPVGDYVVLLARAVEAGTLDIVAAIGGDPALNARVMRRAA